MNQLIKMFQTPRISLRWKLLGSYLTSNFLLLVALGLSLAALFGTINALTNFKDTGTRSQQVSRIEIEQAQVVSGALDYIWTLNGSRLNDYKADRQKLKQDLDKFTPRPLQKENLARLKQNVDELFATLDQVINLEETNHSDKSEELWRTVGSKQASEARAITEELNRQELVDIELEYLSTNQSARTTAWLLCGLVLFSMLAALGLAMIQTSGMMQPIRQLRQSLSELASGDLTRNLKIVNGDELGELGTTYNTSIVSLRGLVGKLYQQSQQVRSTIEKLTLQARSQVVGSSQQASAITSASEAVQELNQTAEEIARQAQAAAQAVTNSLNRSHAVNSIAEEMVQTQQQGRQTVAGTISALQNLKEQVSGIMEVQQDLVEQAGSIQKITGIIDGIARETHLLALNASIEAAGAGQQGERFAVIAREVKSLAERSVVSTQEVRTTLEGISLLIQKVTHRTEESLKEAEQAVGEAGQSNQALVLLAELSEQVKRATAEIVGEIEQAASMASSIGVITRQQQSASSQMLGKMLEIESITTQTLGSIKEGEEATLQLSETARELEQAADTFQLAAV